MKQTLFNEYSLDNYETNVEYEVKIRSCIDNLFGDWSEIIKFKIDDFKGNNSENNIFGQIYNEKDNNQKSVSLFSNLNQTNNLFGFQDKNENKKLSNLFSFNNNQYNNENIFKNSDNSPLFNNNNEKDQGNLLFGQKIIGEDKPLFGNSSQNPFNNIFNSDTSIFENNDLTKKSPQISLFNNNFINKEDKDEKKGSGLFGNNNQNLFTFGHKNIFEEKSNENKMDNKEKDEKD